MEPVRTYVKLREEYQTSPYSLSILSANISIKISKFGIWYLPLFFALSKANVSSAIFTNDLFSPLLPSAV